jgi:hypothetical protein
MRALGAGSPGQSLSRPSWLASPFAREEDDTEWAVGTRSCRAISSRRVRVRWACTTGTTDQMQEVTVAEPPDHTPAAQLPVRAPSAAAMRLSAGMWRDDDVAQQACRWRAMELTMVSLHRLTDVAWIVGTVAARGNKLLLAKPSMSQCLPAQPLAAAAAPRALSPTPPMPQADTLARALQRKGGWWSCVRTLQLCWSSCRARRRQPRFFEPAEAAKATFTG